MNLSNDLKTDLEAVQRIERGLSLINAHVKEIDKNVQAVELRLETYNGTLKVNTASLELHVKRTDLAEKRLELLEERALKRQDTNDNRLFSVLVGILISLIGAIVAFVLRK